MSLLTSYTFLNTYKKCHRRARYQYIDKVIDRVKVNHRPFMVGLVVDWLFTKWISEHEFLDGWMEMKAEVMFRWFADRKHIIYRNADDREKLIKRTVNVARLLQEAAYEEGLPDEEIDTQKIVKYKGEPGFEEFDIFTKVDLWFPEKKALWDLKVTIQKKYLDDFQLRFYAWVFERKGIHVDSLAFFVPELSPSFREVEYDESVKADTDLEIIELFDQIQNETEWAITAKDCWGCPAQAHCDQLEAGDVTAEKKEDGGFRVFIGEDLFK